MDAPALFLGYEGIFLALSALLRPGSAKTAVQFDRNAPLSPGITITITGIPARYHNALGDLSLQVHHAEVIGGEAFVRGASAAFWLRFADPGLYDIELRLNAGKAEYSLPSQTISAGLNTIPFDRFAPLSAKPEHLPGKPALLRARRQGT